ncbi:MAG: RrF2 family transcriptional regulator [Bacteroidetes bacterium]|nr:RrF2 family transcriptional regulator [Rhodothermia bacterium]MCS7155720.1 RrF2 family transcriptional regulator [Bacteroidota bacterium]MCX7906574.1 RrF2 family transcriptional regulator [Bacteroidota bacterium]MDW8137145.1 RrF2 family transcriptional regulator [Bacteroidota bacterium]MDW8284985.1 RrF2 family transcriptional regulator [Bacteroidota bacterium]
MVLSRACEYAIQAVLYLAQQDPDRLVMSKEIAEQLHIPKHFLAKILQDLAKSGLVESFKGPTGGFRLAVSASRLTLLDVVAAVDGLGIFERCGIGLKQCSDDNPCPIHERWKPARQAIRDVLGQRSIAELMRESSIQPREE